MRTIDLAPPHIDGPVCIFSNLPTVAAENGPLNAAGLESLPIMKSSKRTRARSLLVPRMRGTCDFAAPHGGIVRSSTPAPPG